MSVSVELGYSESRESTFLRSVFFPSKLGGKPAWLSLLDVPSFDSNSLLCGICKGALIFLCQIYAPISERDDCFHRTLFVFICPKPTCCLPNCADNIHVFRSQLGRKNDFYQYDPVDPDFYDRKEEDIAASRLKLCSVCGCPGNKECGGCRGVQYCSKDHQEIDWKFLGHKTKCKQADSVTNKQGSTDQDQLPRVLFPEFEIVIETESLEDGYDKEEIERTVEERMRDYEDFLAEHPDITETGNGRSEASGKQAQKRTRGGNKRVSGKPSFDTATDDAMFTEVKDKTFKQFQRRIAQNPEQDIRYARNASPLYPRSVDAFSPPLCESCGAQRVFEFQLMPHLLMVLGVDELHRHSIDWATVIVYTCKDSCATQSYKREFVVKHDFLD